MPCAHVLLTLVLGSRTDAVRGSNVEEGGTDAPATTAFTIDGDSPILIPNEDYADPAIRAALHDLSRDFYKVKDRSYHIQAERGRMLHRF